jgi:DNA-binding protein H-NS
MNTKNKSAAEQAESLFDKRTPTPKPIAKGESAYLDLLAQREALEEQIALARAAEVGAALEQIRQLVADYELQDQVQFTQARGPRAYKRPPVLAKYRNPETGDTWSGRGKPPRWIAGQDRENFLIS